MGRRPLPKWTREPPCFHGLIAGPPTVRSDPRTKKRGDWSWQWRRSYIGPERFRKIFRKEIRGSGLRMRNIIEVQKFELRISFLNRASGPRDPPRAKASIGCLPARSSRSRISTRRAVLEFSLQIRARKVRSTTSRMPAARHDLCRRAEVTLPAGSGPCWRVLVTRDVTSRRPSSA